MTDYAGNHGEYHRSERYAERRMYRHVENYSQERNSNTGSARADKADKSA